MITLSIIIATIGRTVHLENLLKSLVKGLRDIDYEILIIDQNGDDRLDPIVNEFSDRLSIDHHKVNFKGLSKAKNYGAQHAKGMYMTFPDDDCEVQNNTFKIALETIARTGASIVFGKCTDFENQDSILKFKKEEYWLSIKNMDGGFVESSTIVESKIFQDYLFDERMGAGSFYGAEEGYDWLYRILKDNRFTAFFNPEIIFFHPQALQQKGDETSLKRVYTYTCGHAFLCKKHKFYKKYFKAIIKSLIGIIIYFVTKPKYSKYYRVQLYALLIGYEFANTNDY